MKRELLKASPNAKGLIFDLDGTLLDSIGLHWEAWKETCKTHGVEIDYDFFINHTGKPADKIAQIIIEHYQINTTAKEILAEKEQRVYAHLDSVKPIDAVVAVAKENYGKLPMAVGTGSDRRRAETMLRHANLLHLFVGLVCAEDVDRHKPYPDTFMKCAEIMGIPYECCEVFEDGTPGLQAASSAGMIATDVKPYYKKNESINF